MRKGKRFKMDFLEIFLRQEEELVANFYKIAITVSPPLKKRKDL